MRLCAALALVVALGTAPGVSGQAERPRPQSFTSTTTAILVDVVVRDGADGQVMDLSAKDFSIAEDGVAQKIDSFSRVTRGGGIGVNVAWRAPDRTVAVAPPSEGAAPPSAAESLAEQSTTAIVFGHLSSESLGLAAARHPRLHSGKRRVQLQRRGLRRRTWDSRGPRVHERPPARAEGRGQRHPVGRHQRKSGPRSAPTSSSPAAAASGAKAAPSPATARAPPADLRSGERPRNRPARDGAAAKSSRS